MKQDQCATLMAINGFAFLMDKTPATEELLLAEGWWEDYDGSFRYDRWGASFAIHNGTERIGWLKYGDNEVKMRPTMGQCRSLLLAYGVNLSCHWHR